jgi:lipoyl(octanoyl) transferase
MDREAAGRPAAEVLWAVRAGRVEYPAAVALQERVLAARRAGQVPDVLLLLEHPPVITMGRSARAEHLLEGPTHLAARGVALHEAARGGDVTYHGPGQLVGYPILDLAQHRKDVHWYLRTLEEALILTLEGFGLAGRRVPGRTGVWVGEEKVAAIGIGVRGWVTWHGFALNITTDLSAFGLIVPCGIRDRGVTSLAQLLGRPVSLGEAEEAVVNALGTCFRRTPAQVTLEELEAAMPPRAPAAARR